MKNNLFENLKTLRAIAPDEAYAKQSRHLILHAPQAELSREFAFYMKVGVAVSFAFIIMLGGLFVGRAMHERAMVAQANEVNANIQLKLNEIKYLLEDPAKTSREKIAKSADLLKQAAAELREADGYLTSDNVGESLKSINATRTLLIEIEGVMNK